MSYFPKFFLSLAMLGILGCLSAEFAGVWEIGTKANPSDTSKYFVLNNWQNTYSSGDNVDSLPAFYVSDIMLKTMGILRDGAKWNGVSMGNLFSRPHATALFVLDGLTEGSSFGSLSPLSYNVDQTGLSGCTCGDMSKMFEGDNVATHLNNLFDQNSQTYSISANTYAAKSAAADESYTTDEHLKNLVESLQSGDTSLASYGLESAAKKLELTNKVDASFLAELVLIKQSVEKLQELDAYVNDGAPDVFVFTISRLSEMEERYGASSTKMDLAVQLVKDTIKQTTEQLVKIYNGKILIQALVLAWEYPELPKDSPVLSNAYDLLQPFLNGQTQENFLKALPEVNLDVEASNDPFLCYDLNLLLKKNNMYARCPKLQESPPVAAFDSSPVNTRVLRQAPGVNLSNSTLRGLADGRTDSFAAVFLITLFLVVSLGISLYAISWALWTMDPGRDSIIYRQVSDPTEGMRMR